MGLHVEWRLGESIKIGEAEVKLTQIYGHRSVKIIIEAPQNVKIHRAIKTGGSNVKRKTEPKAGF